MTPTEHIKESQRTRGHLAIGVNASNEDLLHATIGISTEAGELLDAVKKHLFYGKKLDIVNIHEELSDICWYMSLLMEWSGTTWEEVFELNIEKLRLRYPEKFTTDKALSRNLEAERNLLETYEPKNREQ